MRDVPAASGSAWRNAPVMRTGRRTQVGDLALLCGRVSAEVSTARPHLGRTKRGAQASQKTLAHHPATSGLVGLRPQRR